MAIAGKPFIETEFDFEGKATDDQRQQYVEDIRLVMETEYNREIMQHGGNVEFYYYAKSKSDYMRITPVELRAFDIRLEQIRFEKGQQ